MLKFFFLAVVLLGFTSTLEAKTYKELRQADKIAITLTGKPLADDLRVRFLQGQISLKELADELSKSPAFIEYYAQFWTRTLGIQIPMDAYSLRSLSKGSDIDGARSSQGWDFVAYPPNAVNADANFLNGFYNDRVNKDKPPTLILNGDCADMPTLGVSQAFSSRRDWEALGTRGQTADGKAVKSGTESIWAKIWTLYQQYNVPCGSGGVVMLPWWDPDGVSIHSKYKGAQGYRVPPAILQACGEKLKNCSPLRMDYGDKYMDEVNQAMTMEAGYLIAHVVAEDKPFSEVLTTGSTVMTGAYGYFMSRDRGGDLWGNFPGGGYIDLQNPVFQTTKPNDKSHYWVARNQFHAGILTTPIYQMLTNGRRAKANKAFETFLCKKFVVPEGAKADPSDANPDLTKRAYCSYCHKTIEPMAAFFNKWPTTGVLNYEYTANANDKGAFDGQVGEGAPGLAKILVASEAFNECSVQRAFEFINGRKMSYSEWTNRHEEYLQLIRGNGKILRALLQKMVLEEDFLSPKEEKK